MVKEKSSRTFLNILKGIVQWKQFTAMSAGQRVLMAFSSTRWFIGCKVVLVKCVTVGRFWRSVSKTKWGAIHMQRQEKKLLKITENRFESLFWKSIPHLYNKYTEFLNFFFFSCNGTTCMHTCWEDISVSFTALFLVLQIILFSLFLVTDSFILLQLWSRLALDSLLYFYSLPKSEFLSELFRTGEGTMNCAELSKCIKEIRSN